MNTVVFKCIMILRDENRMQCETILPLFKSCNLRIENYVANNGYYHRFMNMAF